MTYEIGVMKRTEQPTLAITFSCTPDDIGERLGEVLPKVFRYAVENGANPDGPPYTRYLEMGEESWRVEAGVPVAAPAEGTDDIESTSLPGGSVLTAVHRGSYDDIGAAYEAMSQWLEDNPWEASGHPWDSYVDDPTEVEPDEVRTLIYWPVRETDE
jgi:effector-binding domain-containing protein